MACACKEKIGNIKCNNCGKISQVRYLKGEDPMSIVQKENKKCRKCGEGEFTLL